MAAAGDHRPLLLDVAGADGPVRVTLQVREHRYVGEATAAEADVPGDGSRASALVTAAARATLAALEQATPEAVTMRLEWSDVLHPEGLPPLAVVLCTLTVADVPLRTPGSALLRDKPLWAGARAVLQGLNRRLEIMGL